MDADHFRRLQEFLDAVQTITTAEALAAATTAVSAPLGFSTIMCGGVLARGNHVDARFYFGNWPMPWTRTYLESVLATDPVVQEARRRITPFTWREVSTHGDYGPVWVNLLAVGTSYGWTNGFAVPIHGPGSYVGLASFAGTSPDVTPSHRAILLALAHAAHQQGRRIYRPDEGHERPTLTNRERQVMRWVADGKTDGEIATILSISATTVHSYVEQAKRKLGVRSRSQAVNELSLQDLL